MPEPPVPARPRRRTPLILTGAAALVLAGVVAAVAVIRPGPVADWLGTPDPTGSAAATPNESPPPPVLVGIAAGAPAPTADGLRAAIHPLVTDNQLGPRVHVSVLDLATGEVLYGHGADTATVPASTTKVVTAVAALAARGPEYRIETRALAGANPGEVVLVGGGDPTLAVNAKGHYPGAARLDHLADQVKQALGAVTPTKVIVDSSLYSGAVYGPGWDADIPTGGCASAITALMTDGARRDPQASGCTPRADAPAVAAGQSFARLLGLPAAGIEAVAEGKAPPPAGSEAASSSPTAGADGTAVPPGTELGRVESPPMIRLVEFMVSESDNVVAEALARQVALARNQPASFAGGVTATAGVLAELGLDPAASDLADGSGLSRKNRISPTLLTGLIALAADGARPELAGLFASLPVAGWSGSLRDRYEAQSSTQVGVGVVRAKTGTLTGVNSIAGVVTTADGRLLAFAILADQVPVSFWQAQPDLDRIAAALAACGCR